MTRAATAAAILGRVYSVPDPLGDPAFRDPPWVFPRAPVPGRAGVTGC
ncbi:MAG: hypothetical protein AAGD38_04680 [Acidobacteriota bacterium]